MMLREYIPHDEVLPERDYDHSVPFPFRVERRRLRGTPEEQFRESEVHVVLDKDASNRHLIENMLRAGLYGAYLPKQGYTALVLTMQGFRRDIQPLYKALMQYLHEAGGIVRGTIKEEIAIRHQLIGITSQELPEIADRVVYQST